MADTSEQLRAQAAWGGIGGSGKHAPELLADLAEKPERIRAIGELLNRRDIDNVIAKAGELAWGGIGGSGKHALDLQPDVDQKISPQK